MKKSKPLALLVALSLLLLGFAARPSFSSPPPPPNDTWALTQFRLQTDTHGYLQSNWTGSDPCASRWTGVRCSISKARVVGLSLPSLNLRGPLDSLASLHQLRLLDLHNNRLNGTVSPLTNCTKLKLLYLAGNDISGEIPQEISSLRRLVRLDLSDNNLRGPVPENITRLTRLLTLRLQNNALSGVLPDISAALADLRELNFTNNELYGRLPEGLIKKFGEESFSGNEGLCGSSPLPACSFTGANSPPTAASSETVPSNPSQLPQTTNLTAPKPTKPKKGLSTGAIVAIVITNCVAILVVLSFLLAHYCARNRDSNSIGGSEIGKRRSGSSYGGDPKKVYAATSGGGGGDSDGTNATDRSKLVFFYGRKQFELEDLLRASAEMLGKGSLGTVYKAVLDDGATMAVKRLKDANPCGRKEFEQYMDLIGKVKHPNVVRLSAYYYAKEEKLLVYDYLPNGSLHSLLHGKLVFQIIKIMLNYIVKESILDWNIDMCIVMLSDCGENI